MKLKILLLSFFLIVTTCIADIDFSENEIVGEIPYELSVNKGESQLRVLIPLPKGTNNFQPSQLSLDYSSAVSGLNKELGLGWMLRGLSTIDRCVKTPSQEGFYGGVNIDSEDKYCLDGQKLVQVNESENTKEYRTEINKQSKIVAYGTRYGAWRKRLGPNYFKVFTQDNKILTYGFSPELTYTNRWHNMSWPLTRIEDYYGNKIDYAYMIDSNTIYIDSIIYANKKIKFDYEARSDTQRYFFHNSLHYEIRYRLKYVSIQISEINSLISYTTVKRFELEYTQFDVSKKSLINKIKLCFVQTNKCFR